LKINIKKKNENKTNQYQRRLRGNNIKQRAYIHMLLIVGLLTLKINMVSAKSMNNAEACAQDYVISQTKISGMKISSFSLKNQDFSD
jgi:hypothetical protein